MNSPYSPFVLVALPLCFGCLAEPVRGQSTSLTPQAVLDAARQSYQTRRQQLAVAKAYAVNWFPHSTSFKGASNPGSPHYAPVPGGSGKMSDQFSLAGKAQPGDVLRLSMSKGSQYALMVYAGEQNFVGEQRSVFYYPFRTRLEFNVFPPRRHREHIEARLASIEKKEGKLATLGVGSGYEYSSDGWLTGHLLQSRKLPLYWNVSLLKSATYQLYRPVQQSRFDRMWAAYGKSLQITASFNPNSIVPAVKQLENRCAIRLSHSMGLKIRQQDELTYTLVTGVFVGPNKGGAGWYVNSLQLSQRLRQVHGAPVRYPSGAAARVAMRGKRGVAYWHQSFPPANHIDVWNGSTTGTASFASWTGDPFEKATYVDFWEVKD
ncbi:MAG: hypothetical protein KDB14_13875 [Planctomycetales bacterium]|nr:hypothetical protein [Planctomycetales bacterium]